MIANIIHGFSTVQKGLHGFCPDSHSIVFQNLTLNNADVTEYWRSVREIS